MGQKVLIVGGGAGGATAAARLRRLDESLEIIIFEKGPYISYASCGLPYYIGDMIKERERLLVQTAQGLAERYNIDVRVNQEVLRIDRSGKRLEIRDYARDQVYFESYDVLLLTTGSSPVQPNVPGVDGPNVFTLHNIPDTDAIKSFLLVKRPTRAVVVGGGFIGLEMGESLVEQGIQTEIVEMAEQVLPNIDRDMAALVHGHLRERGVGLHLAGRLARIDREDGQSVVLLEDGRSFPADLIILATGVRPNTRLAQQAGLELGLKGAIRVDQRLRTSDPFIYAVGDAVEVRERVAGKRIWLPLAGPANRQGRLAADAITGRPVDYRGALGTSIAKVFALTVASVGLNERTLSEREISFRTNIIHAYSHATYYPGALPLAIKLLFSPDGKILGAQAVGYGGVDKRIDAIAAVLKFGGTVDDLADLELAYAPPYSSAKDPVNIAGYAAGNILRGDVEVISPQELQEMQAAGNDGTILLDVREQVERDAGMIPGSLHIPLDQLRKRLAELPKDKTFIVYCAVGLRGYVAARLLKQKGFVVKNLSGGYRSYAALAAEVRDTPGHISQTVGESREQAKAKEEPVIKLDACGLQCPGPILQVYRKLQMMAEGQVLEVRATDPGFLNDVEAWCGRTGNTLISRKTENGVYVAVIRKGSTPSAAAARTAGGQDKTIVLFSGDLDKAIAAFIIANGAAAMVRKVIIFCTFWGLNLLRRSERVNVTKGFLDRMFGLMMPKGSRRLGLCRLNMGGFGPKLIRTVMKKKNIASLEMLIQEAQQAGVRIVACQMSMDVMGIRREELIDGVEVGGVASYLAAAEQGDVNLFI